jgi:hypothetical protein
MDCLKSLSLSAVYQGIAGQARNDKYSQQGF